MKKNNERLNYFRCRILKWYDNHGRLFPWRSKNATKYQIVVSEVLLQRTRAETVSRMYNGFFSTYPSWKSLALSKEEELLEHLKPLGLWKRRSKMLLSLANEMLTLEGNYPKDRENLENLPNVGQYIANAIMLFCHDMPRPLLDSNMARVLERYFGPRRLADIRYDPYLQEIAREIVNCDNCKELNWAILDLAATVCLTKKPKCEICPLQEKCKYLE